METRTIGDLSVFPIGLGAMELSLKGHPPQEQGIRTIHAALDAGVRLIDTADAYCVDAHDVGANERLIAMALAQWSGDADEVLVATKGGHTRGDDGSWNLDGRPEYLRAACEASLKALGVDAIGLYQYHRPDPKVPYAESVGALRDLQLEGKIRLVGVSNANPQQIEESLDIVDLAAVQNEYSPRFRSSEAELRLCERHEIAFLPWSPLGGMNDASQLGQHHPEFAAIARERGVTPQQVALAWELAKSPVVIPIPGCSRPETIVASVAALDLRLSDDELARLG
jgi:aryl-alcohol dehydrogenase-like predicted oxidoreductase